jgi:hypothetical protein
MQTPHVASGGRYPVLRAFAIIYVIMAVLALLGGVIGAGWALLRAPFPTADRVIIGAFVLVGSFFLVVGSLAVSEIVKLFMDIEHNTRIHALRALGDEVVASTTSGNNETVVHTNRLREMEEETAEGALLRGH